MGESARERRSLVREAGHRPTSFVSVLAGAFVAFGVLAFVAIVGGAVGNAVGIDTASFTRHDWQVAGTTAAAVGVAALFLGFLLGGYTAGRMSRRMGLRHGLAVFVVAAVLLGVATLVVAGTGTWGDLRHHLMVNDIPTDSSTWSDIALIAAIAAVAAMLLGSIVGGIRGDRWHTRLTAAAQRNRTSDDVVTSDDADVDLQRPRYEVGEDPTTVDVRERNEPTLPSVEEEREKARAGRQDVGL